MESFENGSGADSPSSSVHAYGGSAAVCLSDSTTRKGRSTVALEFARSLSPGTYDWSTKVAFQLTQGELAEATAFLFFPWGRQRWIHGQGQAKKEVVLEDQQTHILFACQTKGDRLRVPVVPRDAYYFRNFLLARLLVSQPDLPGPWQLRSLEILARQSSLE